MSWQERVARTVDLVAQNAANLLPKRVRFWVFIQVGAEAMGDHEVVPEVRFMDLLVRAEGGPR